MKQGFTLVELLVVIAILSILSTLGIANFQSAKIKARDITRKSDLQTISKSLEAYVNDHRQYPPDTELVWGQPFTDSNGTIYTATLPADPSSYDYVYTTTGSSYVLYAYLENSNDPARIESGIAVDCKPAVKCNYKITSTNQ